MADKEIIRPPFKADFPNITDGGYRFLQQTANAIRQIFHLIGIDALTTGIVTKTGVETYAARTITGTAGEIEVANGDGVSGNPTVGLPTLISTPRKFGTSTDYCEIEEDGTIRFYNAATTWQDINFDIGALGVASGAAGPTYGTLPGGTIKRAQFLNARLTEVNGALEVDHEVRLVTVKPHFHALPMSTATGDAKFSLAYTVTNGGDTEPAETVISATFTLDGTLGKNYSVGLPDIDVSSCSAGCQFSFRFYRDPADVADTHAGDIGLKTFGLHVEVQSMGTRTTIND